MKSNFDIPLSLYAYWREGNGKARTLNKKPITNEQFAKSGYIDDFMRFAKFLERVDIPSSRLYIDYMVKNSIHPEEWCSTPHLVGFLKYCDMVNDPVAQVNITVERIVGRHGNLADQTFGKFFSQLSDPSIRKMIQRGTITPMVAMCHRIISRSWLGGESQDTPAGEERFKKISNQIDYRYWREQILANPDAIVQINALMADDVNITSDYYHSMITRKLSADDSVVATEGPTNFTTSMPKRIRGSGDV